LDREHNPEGVYDRCLINEIEKLQKNHFHVATLSYMDDTFLFFMYEDLPWFIQSFSSLGLPLGIQLNLHKTKNLTLATSNDSATVLFPLQHGFLQQALSLLNGADSESKLGIKLLGTPLGSSVFAAAFLAKAASSFMQRTHRLAS
jgi:hypothetical protein